MLISEMDLKRTKETIRNGRHDRGGKRIPCFFCGKRIWKPNNRLRKQRHSFCSRECANSHYKKKEDKFVICENPDCGKRFKVYPSVDRKYCSVRCFVLMDLDRRRQPKPYMRGEGNPRYGKVPTHQHSKWCNTLRGEHVRSSWEKRVADWLYLNGFDYVYEPEAFKVADGMTYTPDFYVPFWEEYLEVKGYWKEISREKVKLFQKEHVLRIIDESGIERYEVDQCVFR